MTSGTGCPGPLLHGVFHGSEGLVGQWLEVQILPGKFVFFIYFFFFQYNFLTHSFFSFLREFFFSAFIFIFFSPYFFFYFSFSSSFICFSFLFLLPFYTYFGHYKCQAAVLLIIDYHCSCCCCRCCLQVQVSSVGHLWHGATVQLQGVEARGVL